MAPHSSTLAWEIPRREEPGRLQSMGSLRVGHDCREPARDIPLVTKVMRKEARHTQRRDRASGVPPEILEHLPPKPESYLLGDTFLKIVCEFMQIAFSA